MINSDLPGADDHADPPDQAVLETLRSGSKGAVALAGLATAIVVVLWFAFYLLVFVPRAGAP
jgi:hypothetical protein